MGEQHAAASARGIFSWDGAERRAQRYGSFNLQEADFNEQNGAAVTGDLDAIRALVGLRVKAVATVVESRDSGHLGDRALGLVPCRPAVGETVVIGVGRLALKPSDTPLGVDFVLAPEDGRPLFWLDPRRLFRLHDQTVELSFAETDEPCHEAPPFEATQSGAISNGDGSLQIATPGVLDAGGPIHVAPHIESLGDGAFMVTSPGAAPAGTRLGIRRR